MACWDQELYSSNSSPPKKWGLELLAKLHLKGSEKVLDIGCRDGKFSAEIARKLPEGFILGVDLSEAMITFARNHFSRKLSKPCLCANRCNRLLF